MVTPYPDPRGANDRVSAVARYAYDLSQTMLQLHPDVRLGFVSQKLDHHEVREPNVERVIDRTSLLLPGALVRAVKAAGADVVHLQHELFMYGGLLNALRIPLALRSLRRAGIPVLTTIHGVVPMDDFTADFMRRNAICGPLPLARYAYRTLMRAIVRNSDRTIVHEAYLRSVLRDDYGCNADSIEVIHLGLPSHVAHTRSAQAQSHPFTIAFFGYLAGYKGLDLLIEAMEPVLASIPTAKLLVAGTVPARMESRDERAAGLRYFERLAERYASGAVEFLGFVPEAQLDDLFGRTSVMVFPYRTAMSTSYAMAYALAAGVPVLASRPFERLLGPGTFYFDLTAASLAETIIAFDRDGTRAATIGRELAALGDARSLAGAAQKTIAAYARLRTKSQP